MAALWTPSTYSDSPSRLLFPYLLIYAPLSVLLKMYHCWQRRNKTWHSPVLHREFLSCPSGCLLSFITAWWRHGHRLWLLLPAQKIPYPPCCVVMQPPLGWVEQQDRAEQSYSNYSSLLSLNIVMIFSSWHPPALNPKFTEVKKYILQTW